jgi:hypothetical protein
MRKIFLLVICLQSVFFSTAQDIRILNPDSLLIDFNILTTTIEENHPMMFSYINRDSFTFLSDDIVARIKQGITSTQFYYEVSTLLTTIGCGHTFAYPGENSRIRPSLPNDLPFDVSVVDTSLYISKAYDHLYQQYARMRISKINNLPAEGIIEKAYHFISADGHNKTYKEYLLQRKFNYYLNQVLTYPDSLFIELANEKFTLKYPTHFSRNAPEEEESKFQDISGVINTVMLTLPTFDEGKSTIKKCFKYISENKIQHLIIDLRDNGGGNGNIGSYVVSFILDSTLTYYLDKKTTPLKHKQYIEGRAGVIISNQFIMSDSITKSYWFKVKPKRKYNYDGKLYVLTNGGTFSTGAFVASVLKHKTRSIFSGKETGGSEYGIGGGVIGKLVLPYSNLTIKFPLYKWSFNTTSIDNGTGVIPDFYIHYTIEDILTGTDKEINKAIELINEHPD